MLEANSRYKLQNVVSSPGYKVVLDLMETECDKAEAELLKTNPSMSAEIVAAHNKARAYREFFERFQKTVLRELQQQEAEVPKLSDADIMRLQCQ